MNINEMTDKFPKQGKTLDKQEVEPTGVSTESPRPAHESPIFARLIPYKERNDKRRGENLPELREAVDDIYRLLSALELLTCERDALVLRSKRCNCPDCPGQHQVIEGGK